MPLVRSLNSAVDREEASRLLDPPGFRGFLGRARRGSLRALADVYVPFQLFRVTILNNSKPREILFAVDLVTGALDPFHFPSVPGAGEICEKETRNALDPGLTSVQAEEKAIEKVRRFVYSTGFFRIRNLEIRAAALPPFFFHPYWLGFFALGETAQIAVLDAVRRRREGNKARAFFSDALLKMPSRTPR